MADVDGSDGVGTDTSVAQAAGSADGCMVSDPDAVDIAGVADEDMVPDAGTEAFLGGGIKELIEGDVISMTSPPWVSWIPSNSILEILGIYPCVETVVPQLILTAITIGTFVYWLKKNKRLKEEMLTVSILQLIS